jgi:hypothetical protein
MERIGGGRRKGADFHLIWAFLFLAFVNSERFSLHMGNLASSSWFWIALFDTYMATVSPRSRWVLDEFMMEMRDIYFLFFTRA